MNATGWHQYEVHTLGRRTRALNPPRIRVIHALGPTPKGPVTCPVACVLWLRCNDAWCCRHLKKKKKKKSVCTVQGRAVGSPFRHGLHGARVWPVNWLANGIDQGTARPSQSHLVVSWREHPNLARRRPNPRDQFLSLAPSHRRTVAGRTLRAPSRIVARAPTALASRPAAVQPANARCAAATGRRQR